jgi:hypothetical protein
MEVLKEKAAPLEFLQRGSNRDHTRRQLAALSKRPRAQSICKIVVPCDTKALSWGAAFTRNWSSIFWGTPA